MIPQRLVTRNGIQSTVSSFSFPAHTCSSRAYPPRALLQPGLALYSPSVSARSPAQAQGTPAAEPAPGEPAPGEPVPLAPSRALDARLLAPSFPFPFPAGFSPPPGPAHQVAQLRRLFLVIVQPGQRAGPVLVHPEAHGSQGPAATQTQDGLSRQRQSARHFRQRATSGPETTASDWGLKSSPAWRAHLLHLHHPRPRPAPVTNRVQSLSLRSHPLCHPF